MLRPAISSSWIQKQSVCQSNQRLTESVQEERGVSGYLLPAKGLGLGGIVLLLESANPRGLESEVTIPSKRGVSFIVSKFR